MKTIGLIGGMSWESSAEYYRLINETVKTQFGGLHSAKCLMYSVDFAEIEVLQHQGKWDQAAELMIDAAQRVERGGADFLLICTNTMHKLADTVQTHIRIPLLHIADATATKIQERGVKTVGLLGTKFTMEENFYKGRLSEKYGLNVLIPDGDERDTIHRVIYEELCCGVINQTSKDMYVSIMNHLVTRGAEGIILGCTEIPLLIQDHDSQVPLFDTTRIHAEAAVEYACTFT
jgi:aspartate racemase